MTGPRPHNQLCQAQEIPGWGEMRDEAVMERRSCVSVRFAARGGRGGRFWFPDSCGTLQGAIYSVPGHRHSSWIPLLFIPTTGSSFHCVHSLFLCFIVCLVLLGMDGGTSSHGTPNAQEIASPNGALISLLFWMDAALSAVLSAAYCWYVSSAGSLLA